MNTIMSAIACSMKQSETVKPCGISTMRTAPRREYVTKRTVFFDSILEHYSSLLFYEDIDFNDFWDFLVFIWCLFV